MAFTDNIKEITPAITQLKSNTPVIVIDGKIYVAGIGGNFIPAGQGGGSASMGFYKCAAVDTANSTWTGYKAVQASDTKIYSYQSAPTSDPLIYYPEMSIPVANKVYTADALCCIDIYDQNKAAQKDLGQDLVFYAPLTQQSGVKAVVGVDQTPTVSGTPTFTTVAGIGCMQLGQTVTYTKPDQYTCTGQWTTSIWLYTTGQSSSGICQLWFMGQVPGRQVCIGFYQNKPAIMPQYKHFSQNSINGAWHNLTATYDGQSQATLYLDGVQATSLSYQLGSSVVIPQLTIKTAVYGYISHARLYNKVLPAQKIQKLANQLTPTSN